MIYKLNLSKGESIRIDEEDLEVIKKNIKASLIQVKQGIFNPSFMISIVPQPDEKEFVEKVRIEKTRNGDVRIVEEGRLSAIKKLLG